MFSRLEIEDWYCPDTGETLHSVHRRLFLRVSDQGRRVIRLAEPTLSSDMAFLFGAFAGIFATAALLYAAGFLLIREKNLPAFALGSFVLAIGICGPVYYGLSQILLGRKCTRRESKPLPGALPPLPYRLGWVMAAEGTGVLSGAFVMLLILVFLIASGTEGYLY